MISSEKKRKENIYSNYSFRIYTPDGIMYIFIIEDHDENPIRVDASAGKTGNSLAAWVGGMCSLINELLTLGIGITKIAQLLSNFTTDRSVTEGARKIYAGPDGIKAAIMQYIEIKYQERKHTW